MSKTTHELELENLLKEANAIISSQAKELKEAKDTIADQNLLIKKKNATIVTQQKKIEQLKKELAKANKEIEEQSLAIKRKNDNLKLNAYKTYFSKSERTSRVLKRARNVRKIESNPDQKRGRKKGTINHKELSDITPDEVVTLSPKEIDLALKNNECIIIGEDCAYKLVKAPATYRLIKIVRPKYLYKGKIYQSLSNEAFGKSIITPSFVSNAIYLKFNLGMPINKLSKFIRNTYGINISNQSWCDYFKKAMELLQPIHLEIEKELVNNSSKIIQLDETTASISKSKKYPDKSNYYFLCGCTTYYDHTIRYYRYIGTRVIDENIDILSNYDGVVVCDGYPGYKKLGKVKLQCCWVHARRYIADSIKIREVKNDLPQVKLLEEINKLFEIEEKISDLELNQIKAIRDKESKAVLNNIKKLCNQNKNTKIDKFKEGINYILKHWDELTLFLTDPCIPIHNNQAERTVGYFAQARKNFQTITSDESAKINAALFTIAITAQANGLDVEKYLTYAMEELHKKRPAAELLPWSDNIPKSLFVEGIKRQ